MIPGSNKRFIAIAVLFMVFACVISALCLWQLKEQHLDTPLSLEEDLQYQIEYGSSLSQVLHKLAQQDVISNPYYLLFEARWLNKARLIKAGEYNIKPGTTPRQLLEQFINGKEVQYSMTLIEGWNYRQVFAAIRENPDLTHILESLSTEEVMIKVGLEGTHPEGQFYPDTYYFPKGTTDIEFLIRANRRLQTVLNEEWENKSEPLPYTSPYQALIMASIIEKETAVADERDEIAGVFVRRLNTNMKLQTDPTVIYAIGEKFDGDIRKKDLSIDSPYNTYVYPGLPPTPIAIASRAAIHAALHPKDGKALYFVSMGNGKHYFSETLDEHNRAVRKYILKK